MNVISRISIKGACMLLIAAAGITTLISACTTLEKVSTPIEYVSFDQYQNETRDHLLNNRSFQNPEKEIELDWNAPNEWLPETSSVEKPEKGILLVHGLGDSPWSFHDIASELASQGFLVRSILLPGHGTDPSDMLNVTAEDWRETVYQQAQALERDVDGEVYLGGFSTGANLVLSYAYENSKIAGLILFSPGFKSFSFGWLAPLVSTIRPWIIKPGPNVPSQTAVRYMNVPVNGYAQYYRTSVVAQKLLEQPYEKPVFMAVAQHDSVLDAEYLLNIFRNSFIHPKSRLIWYGDLSENIKGNSRILVRTDKIPEQRISQFSHMGLLFSPENSLYGRNGSIGICLNSMDRQRTDACEREENPWYSGWGYHEEGKIHARLTFNPYFEWQSSVMISVLNENESSANSRSVALNPHLYF